MHRISEAATSARTHNAADSRALRAALGCVPEPALLLQDHRVTFANPAAAALWQLAPQALAGRAQEELLLELTELAEPGAAAGTTRREACVLRPDGSTRQVEIASTALAAASPRRAQLMLLHDVTELRCRERASRRAETSLRRLAARRENAQSADRLRLARELHDELQQSLAASLLELGSVESQVGAPALARLKWLTLTALQAVGRIVNDLQPLILEELGLADAAAALARQFAARTGVRCRVRTRHWTDGTEPPHAAASACLYRVLQDSLRNVAQHANACGVDIVLAVNAAGVRMMRVRDDGIGLPPGEAASGMASGLQGMRERVRVLGGELVLKSSAARGTSVDVLLPAGGAEPRPQAASMALTADPQARAHDRLLAFFYRAPIGLVETTLAGEVLMMNPVAAQILLPLAPHADVTNLFDVLATAVPWLRERAAAAAAPTQLVCAGVPLRVPADARRAGAAHALSLHRQDGERLMAVLTRDVHPAPAPAAATHGAYGADGGRGADAGDSGPA